MGHYSISGQELLKSVFMIKFGRNFFFYGDSIAGIIKHIHAVKLVISLISSEMAGKAGEKIRMLVYARSNVSYPIPNDSDSKMYSSKYLFEVFCAVGIFKST